MNKLLMLLVIGLSACTANNNKEESVKACKTEISNLSDSVSIRKAYDGFTWATLSGAGIKLRAQSNQEIRLMIDPSIPGVVMVRNGDTSPRMLIQIFDLPNNDINDVINCLSKSENWDESQTCKFKEVKSGRKGVKRFVLVPDGNYALEIDNQMKTEPVPATCNDWGVGNSGMRYFEIYDNKPDKAVFMEIGQDAPLFDENSIELTELSHDDISSKSKDILYNMSGIVCIGHEVRSFKPDGSKEEYWLIDKTGQLSQKYDSLTGGVKNGKPVHATLKLEYNGVWDDGFAAEYPGVYFVREIVELGGSK